MNHQENLSSLSVVSPLPPTTRKRTASTAIPYEEDTAAQRRRLQMIKKGLIFRKLKPKRIHCNEEEEEEQVPAFQEPKHTTNITNTNTSTSDNNNTKTFTSTPSSDTTTQDKVAIVSLADFSAKSVRTLETAELGEFSKAEVISKSLSYNAMISQQTLSSRQTTATINNNNKLEEEKDLCFLCQQEFGADQIVSFSYNCQCVHIYHAKCIIRWLMKGHDHCPICHGCYLKFEEE